MQKPNNFIEREHAKVKPFSHHGNRSGPYARLSFH